MSIESNLDAEMNYAAGLEEDDTGFIADRRDEESQPHVDDSDVLETESDVNFAQSGENTYRKAMLFSPQKARGTFVGPKRTTTMKPPRFN